MKNRLVSSFLAVLISLHLAACTHNDGEFSSSENHLVEVAGTKNKSTFSSYLKTIKEPQIEEFAEPVVYRFWFYGTYHNKVLTLMQDDKGSTFASCYTWNGASPKSEIRLFKKWKCELSPVKSTQAMSLIETYHFWSNNESIKIPLAYLNTGGHLYEIEGKNGKKTKIAFCHSNEGKVIKSNYLDLCKSMFELAGL